MGVDMYHHAEIVDAICALCVGAAELTADAGGESVLYVGSNRLFAAGDNVEVVDDSTAAEAHTVVGLDGLTQVVLDSQVEGTYEVARNALVRLCSDDLPQLRWVGRGEPVLAPQPMITNFPCVVVDPAGLAQPLTGGTNRSFEQDYRTSVYYMRRRSAGEDEEGALLDEVRGLFNLLMSDPYLGGTCWYSQVSKVEYAPGAEEAVKAQGAPVRVIRLEVVARRSELGPAG